MRRVCEIYFIYCTALQKREFSRVTSYPGITSGWSFPVSFKGNYRLLDCVSCDYIVTGTMWLLASFVAIPLSAMNFEVVSEHLVINRSVASDKGSSNHFVFSATAIIQLISVFVDSHGNFVL